MHDREHPRAMLEHQQASAKAERPWRKHNVAADGDTLPDKANDAKDLATSSEEIDLLQDAQMEIASWRDWASNDIKAGGGDPGEYSQIACENGSFERRQAAAHLLVQLDRIALRLDCLDRCVMSDEARNLAVATVCEALLALRDLRDLVVMRNTTAIAKHQKQNAGLSRFQAKKQSFNSWLQEQADAIRQQRPGIYDTTIEKILLKRPEVKAARKGRGYKSGRIRRIIAKK
jgi:hypothetical protein